MNKSITKALSLLNQASEELMSEIRNSSDIAESQEMLYLHCRINMLVKEVKERTPMPSVPPPSGKTARIYTDGSCLGNPGKGGCAAIVCREDGTETELSEGYVLTTNNRMELMSLIMVLRKADELGLPENLEVISDSQYLVSPFVKGWLENWKEKDFVKTANADLWKELVELVKDKSVTFTWVKGHATCPHNNRCDQLAKAACKSVDLNSDTGYKAE